MQIKKFQEGGKYTIKKGDTLSKIAKSLTGDANNWKKIAELNDIKNPNVIKEGQIIIVPNLQKYRGKRTELFNQRDEIEGNEISYNEDMPNLQNQINTMSTNLKSLNNGLIRENADISRLNNEYVSFDPDYFPNANVMNDFRGKSLNTKTKNRKVLKSKINDLEERLSKIQDEYDYLKTNFSEDIKTKNLNDIENNERIIFSGEKLLNNEQISLDDAIINTLNSLNKSMQNKKMSFNDAFKNARAKGLDVFEWNGNMYTTELKSEKENIRNREQIRPLYTSVPLTPVSSIKDTAKPKSKLKLR